MRSSNQLIGFNKSKPEPGELEPTELKRPKPGTNGLDPLPLGAPKSPLSESPPKGDDGLAAKLGESLLDAG